MDTLSDFQHEPLLDWSQQENHARMRLALSRAKLDLRKIYPLVIGEKYVTTGDVITSVNPANFSQVIGYVASANESLAGQAVDIAFRAWQFRRRIPYRERAQYLFRAAQIMRKRRIDLAALCVLEVGKNWREADGDVAEAIDYLEFYARRMLELGESRPTEDVAGERNESSFVSRGVIAVIGVWNFPWAINIGMISGALVTGNTVVFKPASVSAVIGWNIAEIFRAAGLPDGVLNFLSGSGQETGEALLKHSKVIGVAATGSKETGLRMQQICAQYPCSYGFKEIVAGEFGGKDKIIVDSDADLDEAVRGVCNSYLGYQGQKCSACSVVIVHKDVYERFLERLVEAVKSVRIGPPEAPDNFMGPVISERALLKIKEYTRIGKEEGRVAYEGELSRELTLQGYYHAPIIFADVAVNARIAQEEIFGPVLSVVRAESFEEALAFFNNSEYALTGGVFSRLPSHIELAKQECDVGNLYVNREITGAMVRRQPFGGWKYSGVGSKAGSPHYLLRFMYEKTTTENIMRRGFAPM